MRNLTLNQSRPILEFNQLASRPPRAVTRTLRIDSDVEEQIESLAEKEGVSFNMVANKSLRKLVEWEATAGRFGFVQVPVYSLERVFSILTEGQARELGKEAGRNLMQELILFWFKRLDRESALSFLTLSAKHTKLFTFEYHEEEETGTLVLKHDRGPKASIYYGELLRELFRTLDLEVETQETDGQVVATMHENKLLARPTVAANPANRR